ncbi:hypothetical protein [Paenibacillus donghaensis]|uniref:hypothetical protein n=1 Tax=Paenibacillus donghaensis TaxID=414771 RepID=UPI003183CFE7
MKFLDSRHPATFLGLFHPVTDEDDTILNHQQRRRSANDLKPHLLQGRQRPGRRTEEVKERLITAAIQGEIPNDGSDAEMIGAQHKADDNHDKPPERGLSGKARTERE